MSPNCVGGYCNCDMMWLKGNWLHKLTLFGLSQSVDARSLHTSQVLTSTSLVEMFWVELGAEDAAWPGMASLQWCVLLLSFAKKNLGRLGKLEKIVFHFSTYLVI